MNISIKNNKHESFLNDITVFYNEDRKIVAQLCRYKEETGRRAHQGTNEWDCFSCYTAGFLVAITSYQKAPYMGETEKIKIGRRNGEDIYVLFYEECISPLGNRFLKRIPDDSLRMRTISLEDYSEIPNWEFLGAKLVEVPTGWDKASEVLKTSDAKIGISPDLVSERLFPCKGDNQKEYHTAIEACDEE